MRPTNLRTRESAELQKDIEAYLSRGGVIDEIPTGVGSGINPEAKNFQVNPKKAANCIRCGKLFSLPKRMPAKGWPVHCSVKCGRKTLGSR